MAAFHQQPFGHAHGVRRVGGDFSGKFARFVHQFRIGHHAGDQAAGKRLAGVQHVAGEGHFAGLGVADHARQQPGAAVAGHDPDFHEAFGKFGTFAGDTQVAHGGQIQAGADRGAVHGGDHRHVQALERHGNTLNAEFVIFWRQYRCLGAAFGFFVHALDVAAGAERAAGAGQNADPHGSIGVHPVEVFDQRIHHVDVCYRVARFWHVQRNCNDRAILRVQHLVRHGRLLEKKSLSQAGVYRMPRPRAMMPRRISRVPPRRLNDGACSMMCDSTAR